MPTPIPIHRTYCKKCNDFKIHTWLKEDLICDSCKTVFTSYSSAEIDQNIIEKQRGRYKEQQGKQVKRLLTYIGGNISFAQSTVIECDAGQKEIDNKKKELNQQMRQQKQLLLEDYNTNYRHLNRNDKCSCGSSKKFKQCHLLIFREKGLKI